MNLNIDSTQRTYRFWAPMYDLAHHVQTIWQDSEYRKIVAEKTQVKENDLVLDIGTGTGLTGLEILALEPNATVFGADISEEMLKKAYENIESREATGSFYLLNKNIEQMSFKDNTFDKIVSAYGFGGIPDKEKAFREIVRVGKNGSRIVMLEMCEPPEQMTVKRALHNYMVVPFIKRLWHFENSDLEGLFLKNNVEVEGSEYKGDLILGSSKLVYGTINK
ncbi:MAG: class I SAM-dependent methyltransferase [Nanoarchaeota archaeon]|nr:class I SAM-dependent methyltransferase [DPANN group archaeon]MBL7116953.1 class I SAM-dependent methyltransferase [Nanoarchaeota archaeon]